MAVSSPGKLPLPPEDLASRSLSLRRLQGSLFRIHRSTSKWGYFGKNGDGRFDDPLKKYGVLYAALKPEAAFAEVFLRQLSLMLVLESDLYERSLSEITCKAINCVDFTGSGLRRLSCDNRISTERPYGTTTCWSRAIFEHPQRPDGIIYLSRHDPQFRCVALFERETSRFSLKSRRGLLSGSCRAWTIRQITKYKLAVEPVS
jgi:hypothetical protein